MEEFSTGSVRDSREGKGRYDLIPPEAVKRLALRFEEGAKKYGESNWRKGQPFSRVTDSMMRHAHQWLAGETGEDHLAAVAWNAFALMTYQAMIARGELPAELDDMPRPSVNVESLLGGNVLNVTEASSDA